MIAVIDYGAGNLYSLCNSLRYLGIEYTVTASEEEIDRADRVILPGVGAFREAMEKLEGAGVIPTIRHSAARKPLLGICLGMQILFERGYEFGESAGLGLIPGTVRQLEAPGLKIPHMGWNEVKLQNPCALTQGMGEGEYFYFVHSFCAHTEERYISLYTEYGEKIPALVHSGYVYGAQFHPEKSAAAGLQILKNFAELKV